MELECVINNVYKNMYVYIKM